MSIIKVISYLCFFIPFLINAQSAYQEVREGNELFKSNSFEGAENKYREGVRKDGNQFESAYNLGNALYRQGKFEDAGRYFMQASSKSDDKIQKAKAYHNLGNSFIKTQKLEEGIKAYKNALINNPKDEESRYNLAYAMQQQKQQQEQEKQQKDDKKEENKEEEEQEDQNQDKQEEEEEKEQEQQEGEKEEEQKEEEQQQQEQPKEDQVSRDEAERMLEALNNKEKELQEKLKKQKVKEVNINIEKDW